MIVDGMKSRLMNILVLQSSLTLRVFSPSNKKNKNKKQLKVCTADFNLYFVSLRCIVRKINSKFLKWMFFISFSLLQFFLYMDFSRLFQWIICYRLLLEPKLKQRLIIYLTIFLMFKCILYFYEKAN
jgi:hypothetical protein